MKLLIILFLSILNTLEKICVSLTKSYYLIQIIKVNKIL